MRVERLQGVSEEQAQAEGITGIAFRRDDGWPFYTAYLTSLYLSGVDIDASPEKLNRQALSCSIVPPSGVLHQQQSSEPLGAKAVKAGSVTTSKMFG